MEIAVLFELPTTYKVMSEHDLCYLCAAGYDEGIFRTLGGIHGALGCVSMQAWRLETKFLL